MVQSTGKAVFDITVDSDDITTSSFASNSFQITNTGDKKIVAVALDITNALLPDSVFDPFGLAGDEAFKGLTVDTAGGTGVITPSNASYIGMGGLAGFEGFQLAFDETFEGGFESGETLGFSIDLDPNSISGGLVDVLEDGSNPALNVGGISGAELIGSNFTVTFADGTTATSQLQGAGNQAGAQTLASQESADSSVRLRVNGLGAGGIGTYDADGPKVIIKGRKGETARVVLIKGSIQPETNEFFNGPPEQKAIAPVLQSQLDELAMSDFPANAAVEFQTIDVVLTGRRQNISHLFDFDEVADFGFEGEAQLPLGFTAGIIDPSNDNLPTGPVSAPIYLQFEEEDNLPENGEAVFKITVDSDDIATSSFADNSFEIINTGGKNIAAIEFDINNALLPDSVFDPFGLAGDEVFKGLAIDTAGSTGVIAPSNTSYIGAGGKAGFEGFQLAFNEDVEGGFESGETLGFSIDLDPNSISGGLVDVLEDGSNPALNVGGISGAELIGSNFTVTFADGTTATSQLQGAGNQAGAQTLASQESANSSVRLRVNGLGAGGIGTYDADGPKVIIKGRKGETARVVLIKGSIQPETNEFFNGPPEQKAIAPVLQSQLDELAMSDFPANAAVEFQTIDVVLTGRRQNISHLFDFDEVADFDFEGEAQLPLGFTAGIIDPSNDNLPTGPVSAPIYLQFEEEDNFETVLYRINAGGPDVAALDGGITWSADMVSHNSPFLAEPGSNNTAKFPKLEPGETVSDTTPGSIFDTERWDEVGGAEMAWSFDVPSDGLYGVNLFMGNGFQHTSNSGERVFDIAIEDTVLNNLNDIDLSNQFGHQVGGVISNTVSVTDGTLNIDFLHDVQNPLVNGIEVLQIL